VKTNKDAKGSCVVHALIVETTKTTLTGDSCIHRYISLSTYSRHIYIDTLDCLQQVPLAHLKKMPVCRWSRCATEESLQRWSAPSRTTEEGSWFLHAVGGFDAHSWELRARRRGSLIDLPESAAAAWAEGGGGRGKRRVAVNDTSRGWRSTSPSGSRRPGLDLAASRGARRRPRSCRPDEQPPRQAASSWEAADGGGGGGGDGGRRRNREAAGGGLDRASRQEGPAVGLDLAALNLDRHRRGRAASVACSAACTFDGLRALLQPSALQLQVEVGEAWVRGQREARQGRERWRRGAVSAEIEEAATDCASGGACAAAWVEEAVGLRKGERNEKNH
jgi:hypothetical protein